MYENTLKNHIIRDKESFALSSSLGDGIIPFNNTSLLYLYFNYLRYKDHSNMGSNTISIRLKEIS